MNDTIARIFYDAGCRLRGTPVTGHLEGLLESQWWSPGQFRKYQLVAVRDLLQHASESSPFYRDYFSRHRFDPGIDALERLSELPPVSKDEMLSNIARIRNSGEGGRLIPAKSSGTTGSPMRFVRSAGWDAGHRAAIARGCSWFGVDPWMRHGVMAGVPSSRAGRVRMRVEDYLQNRFHGKRFDLTEETLEGYYRKLKKSRYIEGFASMLFELARHVTRHHPGDPLDNLKLVKSTSEIIYPHYQRESEKAFGRRMTDEYGAAESGIVAFECPEGSLHVNMEHVIVDVADDGEIIITNLLSFAFPFIRYRLGDYVRLKTGFECPCGRKSEVIDELLGRTGHTIYGKDGVTFPSTSTVYIFKTLAMKSENILQGLAVQREKGRLDYMMVLREGTGERLKARLWDDFEDTMRSYYGESIEFTLEFVDALPRRGRKQEDFYSEIEADK